MIEKTTVQLDIPHSAEERVNRQNVWTRKMADDAVQERLEREIDRLRVERDTWRNIAESHEPATSLRQAEFARMDSELGRLRAELANARLERDNISSLNSSLIAELAEAKSLQRATELCKDGAIEVANQRMNELTAKDARIAEFEVRLQRQYAILLEHKSRAERAEAELDISRAAHRMVQSALLSQAAETERAEAEREAMREALEPFAKIGKSIRPQSPDDDGIEIVVSCGNLRKARAALNQSPAGREG